MGTALAYQTHEGYDLIKEPKVLLENIEEVIPKDRVTFDIANDLDRG